MSIQFKEKFRRYVCGGDSISLDIDNITITATIWHDLDHGPPDKEDEGFFPSRNKESPWYVPPEEFEEAHKKACILLEQYHDREWGYFWMEMSIYIGESLIDNNLDSMGGLWGNHPKDPTNSFLQDTANELLPEAVCVALAESEKLTSTLRKITESFK